ncbi:MAG: ribose-phosphate pyrophosphokinase [Chlamydiales bacterium]
MSEHLDNLVVFSGSSHPKLSLAVAQELGAVLGEVSLEKFPDGEKQVQILESVRGKDVYIIQSVALRPDEYLMELLIMIDALRRASAKSINAVLPYYGYCRQDRKDRPRVPITAKLVADLIEKAGATRVLTMDLHAGQIQGFFNVPVDNITARHVLIDELKKIDLDPLVVVSPDIGSNKLARSYASQLGGDFAVIDKHRCNSTHVEVTNLIGDVNGKNVLLADDMGSTGSTLLSAAKACQEKGARRILAVVTHGLFIADAPNQLQQSSIEAVFVSDTIPRNERLDGFAKLRYISVAPVLANAISCIQSAESFSPLFYDSEDIPLVEKR